MSEPRIFQLTPYEWALVYESVLQGKFSGSQAPAVASALEKLRPAYEEAVRLLREPEGEPEESLEPEVSGAATSPA